MEKLAIQKLLALCGLKGPRADWHRICDGRSQPFRGTQPTPDTMKPKIQFSKFGQWAIFSAISLAATPVSLATPQVEPSGPQETAEFIQVDIQGDQRMKGSTISLRVEDGVAVISGKARSIAQVERATARAIACSGVQVVVNQMEVKPAAGEPLGEAVKLAFKNQKMVRTDKVSVTTNGSRVSLDGEVGTLDEQEMARELVSEVPGVTGIDNRLTVDFGGERTDAQIAAQLKFMIADDPLCDGLHLVAAVKDGTVRLSGEVGSKGEFDRLVRRSYVTGIMDVQISGLSINSDLAMEAIGDKDYTDEEAVAAMTAALAHDTRMSGTAIQFAVKEGAMSLKGSVPGVSQRDAAEATARAIPGILRVTNELQVRRDTQMADNSGALGRR